MRSRGLRAAKCSFIKRFLVLASQKQPPLGGPGERPQRRLTCSACRSPRFNLQHRMYPPAHPHQQHECGPTITKQRTPSRHKGTVCRERKCAGNGIISPRVEATVRRERVWPAGRGQGGTFSMEASGRPCGCEKAVAQRQLPLPTAFQTSLSASNPPHTRFPSYFPGPRPPLRVLNPPACKGETSVAC